LRDKRIGILFRGKLHHVLEESGRADDIPFAARHLPRCKPQEPVRHVVRLRAEQGRDVLERRMDDLEMSDLLGSGEDIDEIARRPLFFEERESDFLRFIGRRSLRRDEDERMKALFFAAIDNGAIALFENPFFEPIAYYLEPRPSRFAFEEIVIERRTEDFVD